MKKFLAYILIILAFCLLLYISIKTEKRETVVFTDSNAYYYQVQENAILQATGSALQSLDHNNAYATLIILDGQKNYFTIVDIITPKNVLITSAMKNKYRGNYSILCDPEYIKNKSYISNHCIDPNLTVDKKNLASLYGIYLENNYAIILACYYTPCFEEDFTKFYEEIKNGN
jgi:hypothetical protein